MALAVDSYRTKQEQDEAPGYDPEHEEQLHQERRREMIRQENLGLCSNILVFLVYLVVFTTAMFLESSDASSRFADHIRNMLQGGGPMHHQKMALDRIATAHDMYDFMEQVFVPALWDNNTDTNQALTESSYFHPVDIYNRMLGAARIRQVRVADQKTAGGGEGCQVDPLFIDYDINCYPGFVAGGIMSTSNEDKESFGPDQKYKWMDDALGTGYSGSMAVYPAGGYMAFLSTNRTTAQLALKMLRDENFFGLQTRAVFVDFLVWNSNTGMYAVCRIAVEFGPTGSVASYLEITMLSEQMLKVAGHGNLKDWCAFLAVLMIMMFVLYFLIEEFQELWRNKYEYFLDGWNVLDWVNMILLIIAFAFRTMVWLDAGNYNIGKAQLENPDVFPSVRGIAAKAEQVKLLHSFNAVLLWGKCSKYLKHLPIVKILVKTIWNAFRLFLPLMCMFTIALIGFTMAYNIGFGDKIQELTTFTRTIVYLTRSFLRDVKLMPVYYITPIFGAFLILLFYVMLVLVGVQVLFAIVTDAMYRSKHHPELVEDHEHRDEPLEEVLREAKKYGVKIIRMLCPIIYRKFIKKPMSKEERMKLMEQAQHGAHGHHGHHHNGHGHNGHHGGHHDPTLAIKNGGMMDTATESTQSVSTGERERVFTTAEIMLAIQHMSGRVLSEVQEVGIEIRSELHDVCERVAQMQMAVEELSWRAELVRREQETVM